MKNVSLNKRTFTLVEIMVALAVLLLMMYFLLTFVNGAQRIFTETNRQNTLFNDAQAVTALMDNDLKNMVCSYTAENIMPFYYENDISAPEEQTRLIGFFTTQPAPNSSGAETRLYPVIYLFDQVNHKLYRFLWDGTSGSATPWDTIGCEDVTPDPEDPNIPKVFNDMEDKLKDKKAVDLQLKCEVLNNVFQFKVTALTTDNKGNPTKLVEEGIQKDKPTLIRISMVLYSRDAISELRWRQMKRSGSLINEINKTRRRFSKTFILPITSDEVIRG